MSPLRLHLDGCHPSLGGVSSEGTHSNKPTVPEGIKSGIKKETSFIVTRMSEASNMHSDVRVAGEREAEIKGGSHSFSEVA